MEPDLQGAAMSEGRARPTWSAALLFPDQGEWSDGDYLALPTNRLVELSDGSLEVLPMPTKTHQSVVFRLASDLKEYLTSRQGGEVIVAPYPVRLWPGKFREPDVVCVLSEHAERCGERYAEGADLVMEVVSRDDPLRDKETKRDEYARAGIHEHWIADPGDGTITVLALDGERYQEHGTFKRGDRATSPLLAGFGVDVTQALAG